MQHSNIPGGSQISKLEQALITEIEEKLDELNQNPTATFSLEIDNCDSWTSCERDISASGVKAITTLVLNKLQSLSIPFTLDFSQCQIRDDGAKAIAKLLKEYSVRDLHIGLYGCDIGEKGFSAIAKSLATEKCKLSALKFTLGAQDECNDLDTIDGQLCMLEAIGSPHCSKDLTIDFLNLTQDDAKKTVSAMLNNTSCHIEFDNKKDFNVKDVLILNERNRLIKKYPAYSEQIIKFSLEHFSLPAENDESKNFFLSVHNKTKYDEQTPSEIINFYSSIVITTADETEKAKVLIINGGIYSAIEKDQFNLTFLSSAIQSNTEFTAFVPPSIFLSTTDRINLLSLLTTTALRNRLMKELLLNVHNYPADISEFNHQLLIALYERKADISPEVMKLATNYCLAIISASRYHITFATPPNKQYSWASLVIKLGNVIVANEFYPFARNDIENDAFLYLSAIESGSIEMILWFNKITKNKFVNREAMKTAEEYLKNDNIRDKEGSHNGLIIFKQLVDDEQKNQFQQLINSQDTNALQTFLNHHNASKETLIEALSMAIKRKSNKALLEILIHHIGQTFDVNQISADECIYLSHLNLLSSDQVNNFLKFNYSTVTIEQASKFIRQGNCSIELIDTLLKLSPLQLVKNNLIQSLYLKFPNNQVIREMILSKKILEIVLAGNSIPAFALLMALGFDSNEIKKQCIDKDLDFISITLISTSYPNSKIGISEALSILQKSLLENHFTLTDTHIALAQKLNHPEMIALVSDHSENIISTNKLEAIKYLQGAIRINNRVNTLYPRLFKNPKNSYLFWLYEKNLERTSGFSIDRTLLSYMERYKTKKQLRLKNGGSIYFPTPFTYQHCGSQSLSKIFDCGYLFSEQARLQVNSPNKVFPTILDINDRDRQDNHLVCTAPFKLAKFNKIHEVKIKINLSKLPISYLSHCILKLDNDSEMITITPTIKMRCSSVGAANSKYIFYYLNAAGEPNKYSLEVNNEIFHGVDGFNEAICHFLSVINDLPNTGEEQILKTNIMEYFEALNKKDALNAHLDDVFNQLFECVEIDFLRGLPISFEYIEAVQYRNGQEINFENIFDLVSNGKINEFVEMLDVPELSILKSPPVLGEILARVPAYYYHEMVTILEEKCPKQYLFVKNNLIELSHKNKFEMRQYVNEFITKPNNPTKYNLSKLIDLIKKHLERNPDLRASIIENHKKEVENVLSKIRKFYQNIKYVGGNSKMRELLSTPEIMSLLTANQNAVIMAILALEIEAEVKNKVYCETTCITETISQHSMKPVILTLGSVLIHALNQPIFFMQSCPLNSNNHSKQFEITQLRKHVKQKVLFNHYYEKLEIGMLSRCNEYGLAQSTINACAVNDQRCYAVYRPEKWTDGQYKVELNVALSLINQNFSPNAKIVEEINSGLHTLMKELKISQVPHEKLPTLDELVENFLCSTTLLDPRISHLLFDTLHFGVALKSADKISILLSDRTKISFHDFIMICIDKLSQKVKPENIIMAEQLALRIGQLQFWCDENLPKQQIQSNIAPKIC